MSFDFETIVIGAGVIGLATAYELASRGHEVLVLERNAQFGEETSSRNSEVIHAGIYYPKNSLKAQLCVSGKERLYQYCEKHQIPHARTGKLIVATSEAEVDVLNAILKKAVSNNVKDLEFVSVSELHAIEPYLNAVKALRSPSTGIIDTHQFMLSLTGQIENYGGMIAYNARFHNAVPTSNGFKVKCGDTEITCSNLINCGGLLSQENAANIESYPTNKIPKRYLTKGSYFTMTKPSPFKHLIYPVPNTASLGVHVTLDLAGQIRFGPDQEWTDQLDYKVDPSRAADFYEAIRKYYPSLPDGALVPAYAGIRPKVQGPNDPMKDFDIRGPNSHGINGLVSLYGMESPGLTSSLAIGSYVAKLLTKRI